MCSFGFLLLGRHRWHASVGSLASSMARRRSSVVSFASGMLLNSIVSDVRTPRRIPHVRSESAHHPYDAPARAKGQASNAEGRRRDHSKAISRSKRESIWSRLGAPAYLAHPDRSALRHDQAAASRFPPVAAGPAQNRCYLAQWSGPQGATAWTRSCSAASDWPQTRVAPGRPITIVCAPLEGCCSAGIDGVRPCANRREIVDRFSLVFGFHRLASAA
jgi:hypothetical protein